MVAEVLVGAWGRVLVGEDFRFTNSMACVRGCCRDRRRRRGSSSSSSRVGGSASRIIFRRDIGIGYTSSSTKEDTRGLFSAPRNRGSIKLAKGVTSTFIGCLGLRRVSSDRLSASSNLLGGDIITFFRH